MCEAAGGHITDPSIWMCRSITMEEIEKKHLILSREEVEQYIYAHAPHIVKDIVERKRRVLHIKMIQHGCFGEIRNSFCGSGTFLKKKMEDVYIFGWDAAIDMCCPGEGDLMCLKYATMPRDNYEVFEFFLVAKGTYVRYTN